MTTPDLSSNREASTCTDVVPVSRADAKNETVKRRRFILPVALAAVAAALLAIGIVPRLHASTALTQQVDAQRELTVDTVTPTRAPASQELLLPGSVMPFADASIY